MSTQNAELITQLNALLRLTSQEAATARTRVGQASTDATRKELTDNARECDQRADVLRQAVKDLGGVPDVVGLALGRAAAAAKLPLEQTVPMTEALLADLALEHQLFDRARLVKILAADADAPDLVALAERLEDAHGNTIQWLFTVLSETALGGPAALTPRTMQAAATSARTAATFAKLGGIRRAQQGCRNRDHPQRAHHGRRQLTGRTSGLTGERRQAHRQGRQRGHAGRDREAGCQGAR